MLAGGIVGRITPEDKRRVVEALCDGGSYVAMIGDGVNERSGPQGRPAVIAQGAGTQMAKSVATSFSLAATSPRCRR